jgi:quercetin dioxygenase-like cupin family protein
MKTKPKVVHYSKVESKLFGPEAPGTFIRDLINDKNDGAPVYNMRMIEIGPGGNTPNHSHPYEHENYIVEGRGQVMMNEKYYDLNPGDIVLVPPNMQHQYRNSGKSVFKFLCSVPVEKFRAME